MLRFVEEVHRPLDLELGARRNGVDVSFLALESARSATRAGGVAGRSRLGTGPCRSVQAELLVASGLGGGDPSPRPAKEAPAFAGTRRHGRHRGRGRFTDPALALGALPAQLADELAFPG